MLEQRIQRRVAAPLAVLAAIALAAGGGSTRLPIGTAATHAARPVVTPLEHIELVALRAQAAIVER